MRDERGFARAKRTAGGWRPPKRPPRPASKSFAASSRAAGAVGTLLIPGRPAAADLRRSDLPGRIARKAAFGSSPAPGSGPCGAGTDSSPRGTGARSSPARWPTAARPASGPSARRWSGPARACPAASPYATSVAWLLHACTRRGSPQYRKRPSPAHAAAPRPG